VSGRGSDEFSVGSELAEPQQVERLGSACVFRAIEHEFNPRLDVLRETAKQYVAYDRRQMSDLAIHGSF